MDKREAVRVPVRVRARCEPVALASGSGSIPVASAGDWQRGVIDGTVEDISRSGVFFAATRQASLGSSTELELALPGEVIRVAAEVVRLEAQPRFGMGLRFVVGDDSRRPLANFIMRCHANGS